MSDVGKKSFGRPFRARTWMILLLLAMIVPLSILSSALFVRQLAVDRADTERMLLERTKRLSDELDLELARVTTGIRILANSRLLVAGDMAGFYDEAVKARDVMNAPIILRDSSGQQLVNTLYKFGETLPRNPIFDVDRHAIESREPQISGAITRGIVVPGPILIVVVPIFQGGAEPLLLSVSILRERLQAIIAPDRLPNGLIISIVDREGVVVARSHDSVGAPGTQVSPEVWSTVQGASEGIRRFKSQLGQTLFAAFSRSEVSGWVVAGGVPDAWSVSGWRQSTLILGAGSGLLFGIGVVLALWWGRVFTRDVEETKRRAEALGTGTQFAATSHSVLEVDAIEVSLTKASELIQQRTAALAQAQKMEAVGQLTSGVAHDFNNVLGVVVSNLDLLLEQVESQPEAKEFAEAALNASMKGADLVQRLLAFSRKQTLELKQIDLGTMLQQIMPLVTRTIGERIVKELRVEPGTWPVIADLVQLESCVLNLAINARDAMPDGGRLTIDCRNLTVDEHAAKIYPDLALGDYVVVSVTDTGTGIPPEIVERVFEPFFTTKEIGAGSGLGLSMVYGVMRQSGGFVKIYSEMGRGTSVSLYLPKPASLEAAEDAKEEQAVEMPRGGERILVVEDNPEMRHVALAGLRSLGYTTVAAESGDAALALLERGERFDLVFTDIMMPGSLTGVDLAREARARGLARKFVFTSGFASPLNAQDAARSTGDLVLRKPYRKAMLADTIRKVLDGEDAARSA